MRTSVSEHNEELIIELFADNPTERHLLKALRGGYIPNAFIYRSPDNTDIRLGSRVAQVYETTSARMLAVQKELQRTKRALRQARAENSILRKKKEK